MPLKTKRSLAYFCVFLALFVFTFKPSYALSVSLFQSAAQSSQATAAQDYLNTVLNNIKNFKAPATPSGMEILVSLHDPAVEMQELEKSSPELAAILKYNNISADQYFAYRSAKIKLGGTAQAVDNWIVGLQEQVGPVPASTASSTSDSVIAKYGASSTNLIETFADPALITPGSVSANPSSGQQNNKKSGGAGITPVSVDGQPAIPSLLEPYFGTSSGNNGLDSGSTASGNKDSDRGGYSSADSGTPGNTADPGTTNDSGTDTGDSSTNPITLTLPSDGYWSDPTLPDPTANAGDPISIPEGYFYTLEHDLKGNYPCHILERYYNSLRHMDRGLGRGWSTGYSWDLKQEENGRVVVVTPDWKELVFNFDKARNAYYPAKPSNFSKLKKEGDSFVLGFPDGMKYFFQTTKLPGSFAVSRIEGPEGNKFNFSYNKETNFLTQVSDKLGNYILFEYSEIGHITKAKDNLGREVIFSYSSPTGAISGVKRPDGSLIKYSYDSRGNMSEKTFPDGTILVITYDSQHRVVKQFLDKKLVYEFKYHDEDNNILYLELGRLAKTYYYDKNKNLTKIVSFDNGAEEKIYNDKELVVKYVDQKGSIITFDYDENGNITKKTLPNGAQEKFAYGAFGRLTGYTDPLGNSTEVSYNAAGKPEKMVNAEDNAALLSYDRNNYLTAVAFADGSRIDYVRDAKGNALSVCNNGITAKYEYDALGRVTNEYSPSGLITHYSYDPDNKPVKIVKNTKAFSIEMSYEYDAFGNITKIVDPLKRATSIKWAKGFFNRMEEVTDPSGNSLKFSYDETGNLLSKTDRNANQWNYAYDALGRLTEVADPLKNKMQAEYDTAGNIVGQVDFDGVKKEFSYNELNKITGVKTSGRTDEKIEYNPASSPVKITDGNGNVTSYKYNKLGKVIEKKDAEGIITKYAYDEMGRACSVTDGSGNATRYLYNKLGKIESITDPLGHKTGFVYDGAGRLSEKILADGKKIAYSYDELDRTVKITYPDDEITYSYDAVGNILLAKNNTTGLAYKYDSLNRIIEESDSLTGKVISYAYDPEGNRTALELGKDYKVAYLYDALNRVSQISQYDGTVGYGYTPGGKLLSKSYPNGMVQGDSYNIYGRLEKIEIKDPKAATIDSFKYSYDNAGNIIKEEDPSVTKEYSYDKIYRIVSEKAGNNKTQYSYDNASNRLKEITNGQQIAYSYNKANQLTKRGDVDYSYDPEGRLVKEGNFEYTYNYRNLMTYAQTGLGDITYKYDPMGRRISRNNTHYLYDNFSIVKEYQTGFIGRREVSYLLGKGLDEIISRSASPSIYYYQDILGSVRGLVDLNSNLIQSYDYTAFGAQDTTSRSKQFMLFDRKISQPYGFTGRPKEALTGLYYNRYRDYNPVTGRFLEPDPLGQVPGPNIYSYCLNNPINWVDPLGTDIWVGIATYALHWNINVGDPLGDHVSYTYAWVGLSWQYGVTGQVMQDDQKTVPESFTDTYLTTTPEQDKEAIDLLNQMAGQNQKVGIQGPYRFSDSMCQTFSNDMYDYFQGIFSNGSNSSDQSGNNSDNGKRN